MYKSIASLPALPYTDPWGQTYSVRMNMLSQGRKRVAYFYEKADNSTFRYRIYNMVQVLNGGDTDVSASYFFLSDINRANEIADIADVLVICRARYDRRVNHIINAFHSRGKKVLFDVDDFVFNTDFGHLILNTLDQDLTNQKVWDDWYAYSSRIGATLKICDGAITTNQFLAERIREFSGLPVSVVPNFMNQEQLGYSKELFSSKIKSQPCEDGLIHFGYFSGSPSHNRDFAIIIPALEKLMEERDDVGIVVVGYIEPGQLAKRFGPRVKRYPFHDFINLQRIIASVEFNLMPLQYNLFTNCKSELKYFEAAIVGTLSLASPSFTYSASISHNNTGYLSESFMWLDVLRTALKNIDKYNDMAATAYTDSLNKYSCINKNDVILRAVFN